MAYDLIIGGAGLYGATLAHFAVRRGKKVLVLERNEIGGMVAGSDWSYYGIHVFHTDDRWLWDFVNSITPFRPIHYSPLVEHYCDLYSFPINKLTLHQLGIKHKMNPPKGDNFEEACIYSVGTELYKKFFYDYTKKMWGREPRDIPASILKRIPVRMDYNTSYYSDRYVGVPENGFNEFIMRLLEGAEVRMGDFLEEKIKGLKVYTGSIDEYYDYRYGRLPYRGMTFEQCDPIDAMVINYTDARPYVRKVNYKYLWGSDVTIKETPGEGMFYPVPWGKELYKKYTAIRPEIIFAGRLGSYRYMNMDEVMEQAMFLSKII